MMMKKRLGSWVVCGCWTREEFGVIQYVNRQWGCGLVQFSLLFFLPKALVLGSAVTKINHMQFLMGWKEDIGTCCVGGYVCGTLEDEQE